jgi:hypothetical protein
MSITEDAPAAAAAARRSPAFLPGRARRASPWWWLVVASALLLGGLLVVILVWWAASRTTQVVTFQVRGALTAIELDLDDAPVVITGGAGADVQVRRTEEFAFGRTPTVTRAVDRGVLRIGARCPDTVLSTCAASFRIAVPDNVLVNVRTSSGRVTINGLNGSARVATDAGDIALSAFCGFTLVATSATGDVSADAECSADRMELRSGSGDVRAVVPAGRYRVDAHSDTGSDRIAIPSTDDASFAVQALSGSGDVTVEARP